MQKNRKHFFDRIRIALIAIASVLVISGISYCTMSIVSAKKGGGGGTSGPGGSVGGGGCKMSGSGTWVDTCFGGMWKYYPTTENYIHVDGTKSGNVPGGDIIGCGTYGGYYRLALERFHLYNYSGTGVQVGLVRVDQFTLGSSGGKVAYRLGDNHWAEIRQKFEIAKKKYNLPTAWEETGYFCYDPGWEVCDPAEEICDPPTPPSSSGPVGDAHFFATSYVEVVNEESGLPRPKSANAGAYKVSSEPEDHNARISFSTDNSSVVLNFWHKIDYMTTGAAISLPGDLSGLVDYPAFFPDVNKADYNYDWVNGQKVYKTDGPYFDADAYLKAVDEKLKELAKNADGNIDWSKYNELINAIKLNLAKGKTYQDDDDYFVVDVSTSWDISDGSGTSYVAKLGSNNPTTTGTYTRSQSQEPKKSDVSGDLARTQVTVDLEPGDTKLVCQRIHYTKKNFVYQAEEKTREETRSDGTKYRVHDHWDWSIKESSGEGYSEACAEIHRAEDSGDGFSLKSGGKINTEHPYAGENTSIAWAAAGESKPMLRMMGQDATVYLTNESVGQHTGGNKRSTTAPCGYYNGQYGINNIYYCHSYDSKAAVYPDYIKGPDQIYSKSQVFVVPDHTASKLCATFGFNYGRYYNFSTNYTGPYPNDSWRSAGSYWRVYDSSCRTIAKKPTTAIWNGSLMTPGGLKTSTAPRHDTQEMNDKSVGGSDKLIPTSSGGSRTLYGSWSEHLDVVGGKDEGHGSGSTLYTGSNNLKIFPDNVNLTISNAGTEAELGGSGIGGNSAYRTKLNTFLKSRANTDDINNLGVVTGNTITVSGITSAGSGNQQPKIMYVDHDLTIDKNIVYHSGTYDSIYKMPQVIIFVDGNLNITSNVERIDAWLIINKTNDSNGYINTCIDKSSIYNGKQTPESDKHNAAATVYGIGGVQTCSKQLVFNGPVIAHGLKLNRTFGADPLTSKDKGETYNAMFNTNGSNKSTKEAPAEIFNLRADAYLWAYAQAGRYDSSYTESYSRELPPRY